MVENYEQKKIYLFILLILPNITFALIITRIFDGTLLFVFVSASGIIGPNVGETIGSVYARRNKGDNVSFTNSIKKRDKQLTKTKRWSANAGFMLGLMLGLYMGIKLNFPARLRESLIEVISSS